MFQQFRRILMPTDFSAPAGEALAFAKGLAQQANAELWLVHVVENQVLPKLPQAPARVSTRDIQDAATRELERLTKTLQAKGVQVHFLVRCGVPYEEILAVAQEVEADLIVMATQGLTGVSHLLMGSTAERIVRCAPIPVLTFRRPAAADTP